MNEVRLSKAIVAIMLVDETVSNLAVRVQKVHITVSKWLSVLAIRIQQKTDQESLETSTAHILECYTNVLFTLLTYYKIKARFDHVVHHIKVI